MTTTTTETRTKAPAGRARFSLDWAGGVAGPLIGLALLCVGFSLASEYFLTVRNGLNILDQVTVLGILAIGMTMVIIIGGIDLSVGSVLALSMMAMGWLAKTAGVPLPLAMLLGVATGAACGLVSGLLVTLARLPPFIATLAVMSVARGLANIITNGQQIVGYPAWFTSLSTVRHLGFFSVTVTVFVLLMIVAGIFLRYRATGRNLFAIGGNPEVARLAGIDVARYTLATYAAAGALAGIAAVTMAARLNSSQPSAGLGIELDTIAAVVIGGASLAGGVGSIAGTLIGVLIIGVLRNGLNLVGVSPFVQMVVIGSVIALAVTFDTLGRRKA